MSVLERVITAIAVLVMPLVGLAASAHQAERGSRLSAAVYGVVTITAIVQLARLYWQLHKEARLHRNS